MIEITQKKWCRVAAKILLFMFFVVLLLYATEVTAANQLKWQASYFYAYVFLLAVGALLYALTGSLPWAMRIMTIITALYSVINHFVLRLRGTPFVPFDIFAGKTALAVLPGYTLSLSPSFAVLALIVLVIILASSKLAIPIDNRSLRTGVRVTAVLLPAVFFLMTFNVRYLGSHGYMPHFWNQNVSAQENGSVLNFIANVPFSVRRKPEAYSLGIVSGIADGYLSDSAGSARMKPDIILIMGESWSNAAPEEAVRTNIPATPFFDSFKTMENAIYRTLLVTSYGGGTSRSEYQMMTGANATYGFHLDPFQFNVTSYTPNVVSTLKQLGYDTTALHTGRRDAWSRDKAFPLLGFDRFYDYEEIEKTDSTKTRYYLSDKSMYEKMLSILDESQTPQFLYGITIQTHGSYDWADYESPVKIESPAGSYPETEQYLGLMNQTDTDFAAFIGELEKRDRPTLVLAYGDHRPTLEPAYMDEVAMGNKDIWLNQTFYVMWANYPLDDAVMQTPPVVGINYLGPRLLQAAQLPLTGYQKFLLDGARQYPAIGYDEYFDADGNCLPNTRMPDQIYCNDQAIMQYNLIYDTRNRADYFFTLSE